MNDPHPSIDYKPIFYRSLSEVTSSSTSSKSSNGKMRPNSCSHSDRLLLVSSSAQQNGVLMKKPFGNPTAKWTKRFFVIKDGFLLYYPENEKKSFDKGVFNMHPKGVLPLGGCSVSAVLGNGSPYLIEIKSDEFSCGSIVLGAETKKEQDRWTLALQQASRVTWSNFQLGDAMIRELEMQGLQLSKEKQDYVEKLQEEVSALRDEMDKNEELEKLTEELEKEKKKLEEVFAKLKEEHEKTRKEYEETSEALRILEEDKKQLQETTSLLSDTLQDLTKEREETLDMLKSQEEENQNLFVTTEELTNSLQDIEDEIKLLLAEKNELENRYYENQVQAQMLEEEKQIFSEQANYLLMNLNDLSAQKELTESELKEEIKARILAEKRLRLAEDSIHRLEVALHLEGSSISEPLKLELLPDVKNLKEYFEHVAEEAQLDATKPIIMKNAIVARKSYLERVRSIRIEKTKIEKDKSLALIFDECGECISKNGSVGLRRTKSMLLNNKTQKKLQTLRRSSSTRASVRSGSSPDQKKAKAKGSLSSLTE